VTEPVFPGYLFCRFDLSKKSKVLSSNAVERVVGFGSQPAPIPVSEIEAIRRMVEEGGVAAPVPRRGDRVRVIAGSLQGIEGVLVREAAAASFVVSIHLLQRSISLSIEQSAVELI
jgi:transcription antitermination factor NusG